MRKAAYVTTFVLVLLFLMDAQITEVGANPMYPTPYAAPEITVMSPVQNGTYPQNNVWLNLTVTKPSNWTDFEGQLKYVAYLVDGSRDSLIDSFYYSDCGETRVAVEDPLGVENPQLEFNFSLKLTGLSEGMHHINVEAVGLVKDGEIDMPVGSIYDDIYFTLTGETSAFTTPSPTPSPTAKPAFAPEPKPEDETTSTALAITALIAMSIVATGLLVYFKKRKH
jgi:hypothetical protein